MTRRMDTTTKIAFNAGRKRRLIKSTPSKQPATHCNVISLRYRYLSKNRNEGENPRAPSEPPDVPGALSSPPSPGINPQTGEIVKPCIKQKDAPKKPKLRVRFSEDLHIGPCVSNGQPNNGLPMNDNKNTKNNVNSINNKLMG